MHLPVWLVGWGSTTPGVWQWMVVEPRSLSCPEAAEHPPAQNVQRSSGLESLRSGEPIQQMYLCLPRTKGGPTAHEWPRTPLLGGTGCAARFCRIKTAGCTRSSVPSAFRRSEL